MKIAEAKDRPIRIYKDKKGNRYIVVNGKRYKLESDLDDRRLINVFNEIKVDSKARTKRKRRNNKTTANKTIAKSEKKL